MSESENPDEQFLLRADAHIHLANEQLKDASRDKVCASIMFAAARFDAWMNACDLQTSGQMATHRDEAIAYFVGQYRLMLEHHMDDYIANFTKYMGGDNSEG